MKLYSQHGALILESESLVKLAGFLSGGKSGAKSAKASAFFPFILVRKRQYATSVFINHERIHLRQQIETLVIGAWLIQLIEDIYSRLFLKLKFPDYYFYRSGEQEAYRNQHDLNYLKNRQWFSQFKYIFNKQQFEFIKDNPPEVRVKN